MSGHGIKSAEIYLVWHILVTNQFWCQSSATWKRL